MIYIKANKVGPNSVIVQADGILDQEGIHILKKVLQRHLDGKKAVSLKMQGIIHISREGITFLQKFKNKISFIDPGHFLDDYFH